MRGFSAILLEIIFPLVVAVFFIAAIVVSITRRRSKPTPVHATNGAIAKAKSVFITVFIALWCTLLVAHIGGKAWFKYQLTHLRPGDVHEIDVGTRRFTERDQIARIVADLNGCQWYAVNHGGWGDTTPLVVITRSGEHWWMQAGYHFTQKGAVLTRSSSSNGVGWNLGEMFSDRLPATLTSLGVPLSMCDTAHDHPCSTPSAAH